MVRIKLRLRVNFDISRGHTGMGRALLIDTQNKIKVDFYNYLCILGDFSCDDDLKFRV